MSEARNMKQRTIQDDGYSNQCVQKWNSLLESTDRRDPIANPYIKKVTAVLLENEMQHLKELHEDTLASNTGYFTKYVFPILRRVWPNLIANQIVSVQPMTAPVGGVFFYEKKYDDRKGSKLPPNGITGAPNDVNYDGQLTANTNMQQNFARYYSSEFVDYDAICTSTTAVASLTNASTNCRTTSWSPIRSNGVDGQRTYYAKAFYKVLDSTGLITLSIVATMNDSGNLIDQYGTTVGVFSTTAGTWTINAKNELGNASTFIATTSIYMQYFVNWELVGYTSGAEVPSMSLDITLHTIKAESRKLKAKWTVEAVDDMRALHGMEVETEIVSTFSNEVMLEVDREIIDGLVAGAAHSSSYTYTYSSGSGELDMIRNLLTKISAMSARIHKTSGRAPANFIVAPPEIISLLDQLSTNGDYASIVGDINPTSYGPLSADYGIARVGTLLRKWAVYSDPYMASNKILVGLKGASYLDAGFVYAPYIPLQVTPTFMDPNDFTFRKGVRTRYASKMLRSEYYGVITVSGLPSVTTTL